MLRIVVLSAVVFGGLIASDLMASAQQSPRQKCCIQMGGSWGNASQGRGGGAYCFGMGRGRVDDLARAAMFARDARTLLIF